MSSTLQFLSLAPTTSAGYPTVPTTKPTDAKRPEVIKVRRSSSLSSTGSNSAAKQRYLKLGPAHFGVGDAEGDWSDAFPEEKL